MAMEAITNILLVGIVILLVYILQEIRDKGLSVNVNSAAKNLNIQTPNVNIHQANDTNVNEYTDGVRKDIKP